MTKQLMATSGDSEERRLLWDKFKPDAAAHANAEEETLYAALIENPDTQEQSRHSIGNDHYRMLDAVFIPKLVCAIIFANKTSYGTLRSVIS